ncbi:transglutaminase-like domain-containing protein [Anaeromyxobacter diazotrophicus]|uniref:Cro/Cl family transcriptional regulator n=1 Tax=Anaeromyxobacter diazotrophicus TaxID=2590199 RepID=A0A7I9VND0_9BACT|nr:transglutaminase family protein [Anaeromyxobacter diazotrophicus]GEJ57916.1 Cro/Cl family transcriptional regulator [Anaeromyxobacter diazotrophicus]
MASPSADPFLRATAVFDHDHPRVAALARELGGGDAEAVARRMFEWVRDRIPHTGDAGHDAVTCAASEVLATGTGFCYAKSHLLVALLRGAGVRAGVCYQRLSIGEGRFLLHGLAAVELPTYGWYRADPRGNGFGIDAQFTPPREQLAHETRMPGEWDSRLVFPDPLPAVEGALRRCRGVRELSSAWPDLELPPRGGTGDGTRTAPATA